MSPCLPLYLNVFQVAVFFVCPSMQVVEKMETWNIQEFDVR